MVPTPTLHPIYLSCPCYLKKSAWSSQVPETSKNKYSLSIVTCFGDAPGHPVNKKITSERHRGDQHGLQDSRAKQELSQEGRLTCSHPLCVCVTAQLKVLFIFNFIGQRENGGGGKERGRETEPLEHSCVCNHQHQRWSQLHSTASFILPPGLLLRLGACTTNSLFMEAIFFFFFFCCCYCCHCC